jgi:hypothetical protein
MTPGAAALRQRRCGQPEPECRAPPPDSGSESRVRLHRDWQVTPAFKFTATHSVAVTVTVSLGLADSEFKFRLTGRGSSMSHRHGRTVTPVAAPSRHGVVAARRPGRARPDTGSEAQAGPGRPGARAGAGVTSSLPVEPLAFMPVPGPDSETT